MAAQSKFDQIDLIPKDEFEKGVLGRIVKWALTAGRSIVILTEFVVILAFLARFKLDRDLNDLSEKITQKQYLVENFVEVEDQMRDIQLRLDRVVETDEKTVDIDQQWAGLVNIVPRGVVVEELQISREILSMEAVAGSEQVFYSLVNNFKLDDGYEKVEISEIEFNQKKGGISFSLKARRGAKNG